MMGNEFFSPVAAPNASRYDGLLPGGLSVYHFSLFNPSMAVTANTSEIYHSGLMLDDKLTKARTHDYLLLSSPRKVRRKTEAVSILARVPTKFVVWPPEAEDYSFSLQTASNMVMPPTLIGELVKLDKGTPLRTSAQFCAQLSGAILSDASSTTLAGHAIDVIKSKHNLRPFLLDVYKVCWGDPGDPHFNPDTCKDHNNYNDGDDENYP